ncbi:hypothetical protein [Haloplanus salilacus]|uniref:hypothetical protein n=1 Tax=Haloplanus salilacus TaxID=2949994 RepID=UPI0030D4CC1E
MDILLSEIRKLTAVKVGILMAVDAAESTERVSTIVEQSEYPRPTVLRNMKNMEIDGWIQSIQEQEEDVLITLTGTGKNLVELIEFQKKNWMGLRTR